jgi:hypothetical protein
VPDDVKFEQYVLRMPKAAMTLVVDSGHVLVIWRHRFILDQWIVQEASRVSLVTFDTVRNATATARPIAASGRSVAVPIPTLGTRWRRANRSATTPFRGRPPLRSRPARRRRRCTWCSRCRLRWRHSPLSGARRAAPRQESAKPKRSSEAAGFHVAERKVRSPALAATPWSSTPALWLLLAAKETAPMR